MRTLFLLLFSFNCVFTFCDRHQKFICDDFQDIILNENEIVFIESPNFPNSVTDEMMQNCSFDISGNLTSEERSMFLVVILTNGNLAGNYLINDTNAGQLYYFDTTAGRPSFYKTESASIVFKYSGVEISGYNCFQGYIYYEKADKFNCGMTALSQPLFLDDETQIIHIFTPIKFYSNVNCSWTFIAPEEYGFKFTSIRAYVDGSAQSYMKDATVVVKNSSNYIITDIYTKPNFAYYNIDHNITVTLQTLSTKPIFNALISLVHKNPTRIPGNCQIETDNGYIEWYAYIFPNNAICNYSTIIKSNQQLFLASSETIPLFESTADFLIFQNDNDEDSITQIIGYDENGLFNSTSYGPYENGTTKIMHWKFLSDGSITEKIFGFDFILYDCICNNDTVIIPCEDQYHFTLINTTGINFGVYQQWYCANMNCTFTIVVDDNCPDKYIIGTIGTTVTENMEFKIIADNKTIVESSKTGGRQLAVIKPYCNTVLKFNSGPIRESAQFSIYFMNSKFFLQSPIIITDDIPWQSLNSYFSNEKTLFSVELSNELKQKNDSIIVNLHDPVNLLFYPERTTKYYDDLNLTNVLTAEQINSMNLKSFVVFINVEPQWYYHYIAKAKYASEEGCRFSNTVFPLTYTKNVNTYLFDTIDKKSMLSTENGTCQILLTRSLFNMALKHLFVYEAAGGSQNNIEIFNGINTQTKIFSINHENADQWQFLVMRSAYYVVKIPANTSFYFEAFDFADFTDIHIINISSPLLSLIETELYGSMIASNLEITYTIKNVVVQFILAKYDISNDGILQFTDASGNVTRLTRINQTVEFSSTTVVFSYDEPNDGYKGAIIYLKAYHKT